MSDMREQALNTLRASGERSALGEAGSQGQPAAVGQLWGNSSLGGVWGQKLCVWGQRLCVCVSSDASTLWWQCQQELGPHPSPGQGVHWAGAKEMLALPAAQSPERESC